MANKPFNRIFKIIEEEKDVYINGEQIARIEILKESRQVIFYMSDGNTHTLSGNAASQIINVIEEDYRG